jgi:hypothetical protein
MAIVLVDIPLHRHRLDTGEKPLKLCDIAVEVEFLDEGFSNVLFYRHLLFP